jgi:hypothetical protein
MGPQSCSCHRSIRSRENKRERRAGIGGHGRAYLGDGRTRGLDIATNAKRQVADAAARAEAKAVVGRWNEQLSASQDMLWSPLRSWVGPTAAPCGWTFVGPPAMSN